MTPNEIKAIQKNGIDWFGYPLKQDGIWGPKTEWWHQISQLEKPRQDLLRIALGYHASGMGEDKTNSIQNDGTFVDMLLKPVSLKHQPWCIAFVSHCLRKAGIEWKTYHVSAWSLRQWAEKNNLLVTDPVPGDLFALQYPMKPGDTQRKGHGGIYLGDDLTDPKGFINSVDGNVADSVRAGRRAIENDMMFIRLPSMGPGKQVTIGKTLMSIHRLGDR